MFPEVFAEKWIAELSGPGDIIADPFSGRGTAPFQALLMGRRALACDINPVAYVLTRAKLRSPSLKQLLMRIEQLECGFTLAADRFPLNDATQFFRVAFADRTLTQLLYLRDALDWTLTLMQWWQQ
jgi:site-specific DNA-methyltransferase (adenine-specific)